MSDIHQSAAKHEAQLTGRSNMLETEAAQHIMAHDAAAQTRIAVEIERSKGELLAEQARQKVHADNHMSAVQAEVARVEAQEAKLA